MPDPIYFQWQNEYLLRTIYPLRETKLRDFLVFFQEIEIWKQYKDKPASAVAGEVQAFRAGQKARIQAGYDRYRELEAYLLTEDVTDAYRASFPNPDPAVMAQINEVHKAFKTFFPKYNNPVKERYFATARVRQLEELSKKISLQISDKKRILRNNGTAWTGRPAYEAEVRRLEAVALKMVEQELRQLVDFVAAYERLYQYKLEALKQKTAREKELQAGTAKLQKQRAEQEALQTRLAAVQAALYRYRNPPDMPALRAYFLLPDVTERYRQKLVDLEPQVQNTVRELHRVFSTVFPGYKNASTEKYFAGQRKTDLENLRKLKLLEQQTAARLGRAAHAALLKKGLQMLDEELGRLTDFHWGYEIQGKPAGFVDGLIAQAEKEQADLQNKIRAALGGIAALEETISQARLVTGAEDMDLILSAVDALPVGVKDLALNKVEAYKDSLKGKDHQQLLEMVVQEFTRSPTRYPLWLQYMVIHFSGMRYQSAHGSWADPRDMLLSLRMRAIEQNLRRTADEAIRAMCEERYQCYLTAGPAADDGAPSTIPALARTSDPYWKRRIELHVKALNPAGWQNKFRALLDVEIDEEDYEIQKLPEREALARLEDMKDQIPEWMWKEIVRSTNLRLTQVQQENWEQISAEEIEQRSAAGMGPYREILLKWKQEHLTGWREEHDRASGLIVTRAVCNEVAEHIQHLRGRSPTGGLTAKPEWYMRNEKDPRLARVPDKPYFVRAKSAADFRPGASIFWLNWVNKEPNMWQIARPITLRSGEELLEPFRDSQMAIINLGSGFQRRGTYTERAPDGSTVQRQVNQWLRWMHEATVVEVAETAEGPTVLTFETALPGEDRRQATIGVFKRYVDHLKYNVSASVMNGTFTGYIPEGAVPYDDLRDMLDWNRVLLRSAFTPAQIEEYWKQVEKPIDPSIAFAAPFYVETPVEAAPRLDQASYREAIVCYERDLLARKLTLYQPLVELRRGTRLMVAKDQSAQFEGETCCLVTRCDYEPRAEGLYVRAAELIDAPEETSVLLARARKALSLYRLCGADAEARPIFEESPVRLRAGTRFLLSAVHQARPTDAGGIVRGRGRQSYSLIIACPDVPEAEGLFVRRSEQRKI